MRLFTAIELGDVQREKAARITSALRQRVEQNAPHARLTWIPEERLHLTLRFIGSVDVPLAEHIVAALRLPLPLPPFTIEFGSLGAFPARGAPRVIWVGVGDGRDAVVRLEAVVSERLLGVGVPADDRPYRPHLTLARVREPAGLRTASLFDGVSSSLGRTRVDAITLFESRLSPKGSAYTVLQRTRLQAADSRLPEA